MSHRDQPSCMVYLDGKPRMVPWKPCCSMCARGLLGIDRGVGVARELGESGERSTDAIDLEDHEFNEGERYVSVGLEASGITFGGPDDACDEHPDGCPPGSHESRQPWQQDPDAWKDVT